MDIVINTYGFWTLVDVVIVDLIRTYLVQQTSTTTIHITTIAIQDKAWSYT
jgi:nicotinamide riboside transporter PnuC